jgi:hypothetical protein
MGQQAKTKIPRQIYSCTPELSIQYHTKTAVKYDNGMFDLIFFLMYNALRQLVLLE